MKQFIALLISLAPVSAFAECFTRADVETSGLRVTLAPPGPYLEFTGSGSMTAEAYFNAGYGEDFYFDLLYGVYDTKRWSVKNGEIVAGSETLIRYTPSIDTAPPISEDFSFTAIKQELDPNGNEIDTFKVSFVGTGKGTLSVRGCTAEVITYEMTEYYTENETEYQYVEKYVYFPNLQISVFGGSKNSPVIGGAVYDSGWESEINIRKIARIE